MLGTRISFLHQLGAALKNINEIKFLKWGSVLEDLAFGLDIPPVYDPFNPAIVYLKIAQDETKYLEALDVYMDYVIKCTTEEQDNDEC